MWGSVRAAKSGRGTGAPDSLAGGAKKFPPIDTGRSFSAAVPREPPSQSCTAGALVPRVPVYDPAIGEGPGTFEFEVERPFDVGEHGLAAAKDGGDHDDHVVVDQV